MLENGGRSFIERRTMKELQTLLSALRKAIEKYDMISPGDTVGVGVSGGKDSLAMLCALAAYRDFGIFGFDLIALTVDLGFHLSQSISAERADLSQIKELCKRLKVPFIVEETQIAPLVFDVRREKSPCSLCANMRRGALVDLAKKNNATRLALGHHRQDVSQTVMMNLIHEGRFGCFSPVTTLEDKSMRVIRPMILCDEKAIKAFARKASLPVLKSPCPRDASSERAHIKEMLEAIDKKDRGVDLRIMGALCRSRTDGWKE